MTDDEVIEEKLKVVAKKYPIVKFFTYAHLPPKLREVSRNFAVLAGVMADQERNAETSAGLRKLLEAKDCAVRAALP